MTDDQTAAERDQDPMAELLAQNETEVADAAPSRSPLWGIIALAAQPIGIVLMVVGFVFGIDAALNSASGDSSIYIALFLLGGALVLAGLAIAVVRLVQRRTVLLGVLTIVLALIPIVFVIYLRVIALQP